jgi:murein DD-endopeptidase MepM/ murein hydrolase activator NlpD
LGYKKKNSSFGVLIVLVAMVSVALYIFFSATFEREAPVISVETNGYWNLKKPLKISLKDASGIQAYKVTLETSQGETTLMHEQMITLKNEIHLEVKPPRTSYTMKDKEIKIIIEAKDASKWNMLKGNSSLQSVVLSIDKRKPQVSILSNSYKISRGGSALVIFKAKDDNLDQLYIQGNGDKHFEVEPFYRDGYYISLLAWPVTDSTFKATVVAKDKAGNITKSYIPLYLKQKEYHISKITLSDRFLKGKIADLAEEFVETEGVSNSLEQFKLINEDVRAKNEALIHKLTSPVSEEKINNFKINKMYPLKNAQVVARFGDHRKYYYDGEYISDAYHLGLDLASNAMAEIKPQNGGEVIFSDYNGLYGNMPVVSHGLGLYTIYGHCSNTKVNSGDELVKGETIANTGKSGYAMGDHLHFGVLVQGIEVRPQEWMDKQWIQLNITDVIKNAKEIIERN